jgi:hypothetical protein
MTQSRLNAYYPDGAWGLKSHTTSRFISSFRTHWSMSRPNLMMVGSRDILQRKCATTHSILNYIGKTTTSFWTIYEVLVHTKDKLIEGQINSFSYSPSNTSVLYEDHIFRSQDTLEKA